MGNKNDRWSALSMSERADLIKLYVNNSITSLDAIKRHYNSFGPGGHIETDEYGYPADITPAVVTQDEEFNKFLMTLPDNQRLTPEEDYHTYQYWKINGKPKDFSEALDLGMYHYDSSDNSYHANSVAFDNKGVGYFMKPKHHPTVKYELDWFNKGIGTLEGGKQYPLQGEGRKEWEDFRNQYQLDSTGADYKYVPRKHHNSFDDGGDTKDENKTLGYTTTSQQDLQDIETFNSNWFKYRDSQLANSARRNPYRFKELNSLQKAFPFWVSDDKLANLSRDWIDNKLDSVVETHTSEALKDEKHRKILKEIYHEYFPYGAVDSKTLTPREITDSDLKYIDQLRGGTYIIPDHTIIYADGNQNTTAKIHERLHAAQPVLPYSVDHTPVGTQDEVYFDKYYDSQREIYARLMELRYANKLDPSHTYTIKEVKAMRNDPNFKDSHIFDRYTDEYILMLLNDVAQNNIDENRLDYVNPDNIAAFGGKLNKFETGGPKDSKHVEDVVRTTRGSTGRIFTRDFPWVDVIGAKHLFDSWRVMKGSDKKVAPPDDNYTGTAMKGVGVQTDNGLGFASQQDLANTLGYTPTDFVDTYVYGDTPFEELGVFKKGDSPERHVVRSKVKKVEDSGKQVNTYQTQRDTLDTNTVAALDSLLNAGLVDLRSENTTYQKSPFNIGDSGIIYDGNNSTIATAYLPNGMPVSKAIDVFDTDPKEWNYSVGPMAKKGLSFIHDNTNPFLMTTPWYYPIKSTDYLSRLYYLFGIDADREYNVRENKGDKNGVIWELSEALEWLDNHPDLTEMPVKDTKK